MRYCTHNLGVCRAKASANWTAREFNAVFSNHSKAVQNYLKKTDKIMQTLKQASKNN